MGWLKSIFGSGQKNEEKESADLNEAIAFVDYEHWYYSLQKLYHLKPNPVSWRKELEETYHLENIMVFADFSHRGIREEIGKIRNITNAIIETQNSFAYHKKDMTDFIMLDYIYQYVAEHPKVGTFIIFTGDGHFQSVVKYLTQRLNRQVIVYGVKDAFSSQLKSVATRSVEVPVKGQMLREFYPMIVSNLAYVSEKINIIPTFQGTVKAVASKNNVSEELIHAALAEMLQKGLIYKQEQKIGLNNIKIIAADWDALVRVGLWSYN